MIDRGDRENGEPEEPAQLDELTDAKQHGLGHLLNPLDPEDESTAWRDEFWRYIVQTDALGQEADEPYWLDRPAVGRFNVSTPMLARAFERFNRGKPHWRQVRPFNFMLVAHSGGLDRGELTSRFLLVTRYEKDPTKWTRLRWINVYDPNRSYNIRSGRAHVTGSSVVTVKTYRDVLADYRTHPEPKSLGPDGTPCDKETIGVLGRRHVRPIPPLRHRGKEGNRIDQREAGVADPDTTHTEYREREHHPLWQLTVAVLRTLPAAKAAAGARMSHHTLERGLAGQIVRKDARVKLTNYAVRHARAQLRVAGKARPADPEALLAAYLDHLQHKSASDREPRLCACGCGQPIPDETRRGRPRKYINETHRKRAQRATPGGHSQAPSAKSNKRSG